MTLASADTALREPSAFWDPSDLARTESELRAQLSAAEAASPGDATRMIGLLAWLARARGQQRDFAGARESLGRAESLLGSEPETPADTARVSSRVRYLIERGRLHILERTPSQAKMLFSEAWTLSVESGEDHFCVEIAQLMAESEPQKSQFAWIERAIRIAEDSAHPRTREWLGSLYMALGWKFFDLRQYDDALTAFDKALSHFRAREGKQQEAFVARWSIGKVLRVSGRTETALEIQQALFAELGIGGRRDGRLYEELAECLQTLKRATEAQLYFELAYRELSGDEWVNDNQPVQLKRLKDLGKVKP